MSAPFDIDQTEASYWWRTNVVAGVILHRLMLLFIAVPAVLVWQRYYLLSGVVFMGMIPYGFFLRYLAKRTVSTFIEANPETVSEFQESGIISGGD